MILVRDIPQLRQRVRDAHIQGLKVGFVPTMGNLHAGHIELVRQARQECDLVISSVFVNPTQFGPNEDFDAYPRTLEDDETKLAAADCDILFAPSVDTMYPRKNLTWVDVDQLGDLHCGAARPGHFRGVTTVVSKLFNIVQPDRAYFGQKDFQQLAVIRRMVEDLFLPVEVIGIPTQRAEDGLALSSRNGYLSADDRAQAPLFYQTLLACQQQIQEQPTANKRSIEQTFVQRLTNLGFRVDYFNVSRQSDLVPAEAHDQSLVILAAVFLGKTRLIDNIAFDLGS